MCSVGSVKQRLISDNSKNVKKKKKLVVGLKTKNLKMETFENFLNAFLTPNQKSNSNVEVIEISSESDSKSKSFEDLIKSMLEPTSTERFGLSQISKDEDVTFFETINMMLTPQLTVSQNSQKAKKRVSDSTCSNQMSQIDNIEYHLSTRKKMKNNNDECDFNSILKQLTKPSSINTPTIPHNSQPDNFRSPSPSGKNLNINDGETHFKEMLSEATSDFDISTTITITTNSKEIRCCNIGTQTSFDKELDVKSQETSNLYLCKFLDTKSLLNLDSEHNTVTENNVRHENIELNLQSTSRSDEHFLEILAEDITKLPDGRKIFNNISKIATTKWLELALNIMKSFNFREKQDTDIVETDNSYALYVDYCFQIVVEATLEDKLIFKISKQPSDFKIDHVAKRSDFVPHMYYGEKLTPIEKNIIDVCNDQSLISSDNSIPLIDKNKIKIKIHGLFSKLYEAFESGKMPRIIFRNSQNCCARDGRLQVDKFGASRKFTIKYKITRKRVCLILYVLAKIYYLLQNETKITKRELFYQLKNFVKNQGMMDRVVYDLTCIFGVSSYYFNILSNRGIVFGDLKIVCSTGEVLDCSERNTLIPDDMENILEIHSNALFIFVVEKDSIFQKLLEENLPKKLRQPFIMITSKGMPCLNVSTFLNKLSKILSVPVFILTDPDAYGIQIMLTYRFGSRANSHITESTAVPHARWLGVFPSELSLYEMPYQKLTRRDKQLIKSMLEHPCVKEHEEILKEIQLMESSNKKGSIEGLIKNSTFLSISYIQTKISCGDFK